jgi:isopenicillin N synthase-like dioxygenase
LHTQSDGLSVRRDSDFDYTAVQGSKERLLVLAGAAIEVVAQNFIPSIVHKVQMENGGEKQSFAFLGGPRGKDVDQQIANGFNINYDAL